MARDPAPIPSFDDPERAGILAAFDAAGDGWKLLALCGLPAIGGLDRDLALEILRREALRRSGLEDPSQLAGLAADERRTYARAYTAALRGAIDDLGPVADRWMDGARPEATRRRHRPGEARYGP